MTQPIIEHVNMTVSNPDRSAALMTALFGWKERWRGPAQNAGFTIHVGGEQAYIAFYTGPDGQHADSQFQKGEPLNHVGVLVEDIDAVEQRVIAAGLAPFSHGDYDPGRRFYFFDHDGIEFEVISYPASKSS